MKNLFLLFLLTICVVKSYAQTTNVPVESKFQAEVKFEEQQHDFGTVREGEVVSWEFKFTNTGDTLLIISRVVTPCGCTVAEWPKDPIKPGESGKIKVSFDSKGRPGRFNKTITVLSNSKNKIDSVVISVTVERGAAPPAPKK
jgi:hypothetical protein